MKNILCKLGIHRPLKRHKPYFHDHIGQLEVYRAQCPCGKGWMIGGKKRWFGFKVETTS